MGSDLRKVRSSKFEDELLVNLELYFKMQILITGAQGQLGHALQQALSGEDLILKDLPEFDLTQSNSESQIVAARPSVILHVGAYTNVDGAEREPDQALAVNALGTTFVARAAARSMRD